MRIVPRQTCEAKFCSFLRFETDNNASVTTKWSKDPQLARNFASQIQPLETASENFILELLRQRLKQSPEDALSLYHLCAYLQPACYRVAYKFANNHFLGNLSFIDRFLSVFNIAETETLNREKAIRRLDQYNPQRSRFGTYVQTWLKSAIADAIYAEYRIGKYSDWGLLNNSSATALRKALQQKGYPNQHLQTYQTAWECFRNIYSTTPPTAEQFQTMASLYNQQAGESISPTQLKQWLTQCAVAVRDYEQQKCVHHYARSLPAEEQHEPDNAPQPPLPKALTVPSPRLEDSLFPSQARLNHWLQQALAGFRSDETETLFLHYGLNL